MVGKTIPSNSLGTDSKSFGLDKRHSEQDGFVPALKNHVADKLQDVIPKRVRSNITRAITDTYWPISRMRSDHEIHVDTYYPGCIVKITTPDGRWHVEASNRDPSKIPTEDIVRFFSKALHDEFGPSANIRTGRNMDFRIESVCLENWRDICEGRIDDLIADQNDAYECNRVGAFGFLKGGTKPDRLAFVEWAETHPERFEFIATQKYTKGTSGFLSLLDYKRKFKYVIDLPGHSYSTKSYWMLFLGRPLFYVQPTMKFHWERQLKPWVHYIPVRRDYADLIEHYDWAEANPEKVAQICENMRKFGVEQFGPKVVVSNFVDTVRKCLEPSPAGG
ncbi:MAG: glycosyl transferase family 90 [Pseudomonadota bacterium]